MKLLTIVSGEGNRAPISAVNVRFEAPDGMTARRAGTPDRGAVAEKSFFSPQNLKILAHFA